MPAPAVDTSSKRVKDLSSQARKLRGWVSTDPGQNDPLVDVLNDLTAYRLLAHAWIECFTDAQEALTRASQLVADHGAVGPFTPADDATRFFTATTHVAWAQAGAGHSAGAGQALVALQAWRQQVAHLDLAKTLEARTVTWFHLASARVALSDGRLDDANAAADAALARIHSADQETDDAVRVDALSTAAEARWAAGYPDEALALGTGAVATAWRDSEALFTPGARVTPAWVSRVLTALATVVSAQSHRLTLVGNLAAATAVSKTFVDRVTPHLRAFGDPAREALTLVTADHNDGAGHAHTAVPSPIPAWTPLSESDALLPSPQPEIAPNPAPATPTAPRGHPPEPTSAPSDAFQQRYEAAKVSADHTEALAAATAWVEAARQATAHDELTGTPGLIAALRALGESRSQSGDWWGSRQPTKEAKALSKRFGRA